MQLRQNRTYRDHDLTSCAFRCAATAAVSESRRAPRVNDVFFIVGVIVLIIAKITSIMHDGAVMARALESSFAGYCRICTGRFP